jgi:hypothetical protein
MKPKMMRKMSMVSVGEKKRGRMGRSAKSPADLLRREQVGQNFVAVVEADRPALIE